MTRIAYINGRYQSIYYPAIFVEDRGYQFADAVYEVCAIEGGRLLDVKAHLDRLTYSLKAIDIRAGHGSPLKSHRAMAMVMREVVRRNRIDFGMLYIQVSRGVAVREHLPPKDIDPVLVMTCKPLDPTTRHRIHTKGIAAISVPDIRWGRCDIKSVSLLANVLAKQAANDKGAQEAWQVRDGLITEGASANAWMIKGKTLHTAPIGFPILNGTIRKQIIALAAKQGLRVQEKSFSIKAAQAGDECFSSAATNGLLPIISLDGKKIGAGKNKGKVGAHTTAFIKLLNKSL
ncbi:MAG: D-amino acid aminotransferase [Alphaproteobacteria bacterium]|nr:D-amino acid aminotransferase [Alphaproteobacteria bacterium]